MKNLHSLGLSIFIALLLSACGGGGFQHHRQHEYDDQYG